MLQGKRIIVGITGGIAAYKSVLLIRQLIKKGAEVQVVITPSGRQFITPVTLSALTNKPVITEFFTANTGEWHSHVDLGLWADAMIIAPATASTIAKMAHGVADNMLVTTYLSSKAPIFIAPAMDLDMFRHPSTTNNIKLLQSYGNHIIEPTSGELASGLDGKGRMEEPEEIVKYLENYFMQTQSLRGKQLLITAGPTYEKIDAVRFIGNYSSGKMGYAIAQAFANAGAEVTLISGPTNQTTTNPNITRIDVESAKEMLCQAEAHFPKADIAIMCAAVADYAPAEPQTQKIKRTTQQLTLCLKPNPDIAATLGEVKRPNQLLIGFALESENEETNASDKLIRKNLNYIILNSLADKGACFGGDNNKITIIDREGNKTPYPMMSKQQVAKEILNYTTSHLTK